MFSVFRRLRENKGLSMLKTFLEIIRARNCMIAFFGVLVGALLSNPAGNLPHANAYFAALAAAVITGGGNTLNDYFDYKIDKSNRPNRPIPSGRVPRSDALMLALGLLLMGLGLSKTVNEYCLIIAAVNAATLVIYAIYSKEMLFLANVGVSYLVASVFIFGALSTLEAGEPLDHGRFTLVGVLTACAFFMTLSREIIKDVEDIDGDRRFYAKTIPIVFGPKKAKAAAIFFALAAITLSITPVITELNTINLLVYGILIAVADLTFISALTMFASLAQRMMIVGMSLSLLAFFFGKILA